jgi:hypothetical protein
MRSWAFIAGFVLCAASTFFSYNEISLLLDPYNVVWRAMERPRDVWVVEQFRNAKIAHLAAHPASYEALMLADSRGAMSKTGEASRAANLRIFNLSASGDSPVGFLPKVKWAVDHQAKLRKVILILTPRQFQDLPPEDQLIFHEHPYVSGESWFSYYWTFSNLPYATFSRSAGYYARRTLGMAVDRAVVVNSGFDPETGDTNIWGKDYSEFEPTPEDRAKYEAAIAKDPPGRLHFHNSISEPENQEAIRKRNSAPLLQQQIESFAALISLLQSRKIDVECVIPPLSLALLRLTPLDLYFQWMQVIAEHCGALWDFSRPGPITADNYNYWDIDHFLPHVASAMLMDVLRVGPAKFGHRVALTEFSAYREHWLKSGMQLGAEDGQRLTLN